MILSIIYLSITIISIYSQNYCVNIKKYNYTKKLISLSKKSDITVLVHVHIPKAGGTALALAMSSACKCETNKINAKTKDQRQLHCYACKKVRSRDNKYMFYYTMSRLTGWKFGVHSPLAFMKYFLTDKRQEKFNFAKKGLFPVFVVMVREPFDRFISESINWVGNKERAVDWNLKLIDPKGNIEYLAGLNRTGNTMKDYLLEYARLPSEFIIQNRQTKMIGGHVYDFNMRFNPEETIGSRWERVYATARGETKNGVPIDRAKLVVRKYDDVILGIQERFTETICILEILYGHLYPFNWQPNKHTHHKDKDTNPILFNISNNRNTITKQQEYNDIYNIWAIKNQADIEFYQYITKVFDEQFKSALCLLTTTTTIHQRKHVPHCLQYL